MKQVFRNRWLKRLILLVAAVVVALYIVFPVGMGIAAIFPGRATAGSPPASFEAVTLLTADQVSLAGWYKPPENGAVILLLHGAGGSREDVRIYAELLVSHGYGVLALDLRGHGASSGSTNRLGWQGSRDVGAAMEYLEAQPGVEKIGGLGLSMGGEVLLGAAELYQNLTAIAADGATRRSTSELFALPSERPLVRSFTARLMYAAVQVFSGEKPPSPLLDSMIEARSTVFFLVAAGDNDLEVAFNQRFVEVVGERAALWIAPGAPHTGAYRLYPAEYEQRVINFFNQSLLGVPISAQPDAIAPF